MDFTQNLLVFSWILLHVGALVAAWATRVLSGSRAESICQVAFFGLFCCLSGAAWLGHQTEMGLWIPSGATMVAMLIMAVADVRTTTVESSLGEPQ